MGGPSPGRGRAIRDTKDNADLTLKITINRHCVGREGVSEMDDKVWL